MEALTLLQWIFDVVAGLGLLLLAWWTLSSKQLFRAIVMFVAFGLMMSLVWVRLDAPDIALAEVAIGAGLTGALLLAALARLIDAETLAEEVAETPVAHNADRIMRWLPAGLLLMIGATFGYIVLSLPPDSVGLAPDVAANLDRSGVSNPVTAVLLNFRGYDTLLEILVLLLALLGVWSLGSLPVQHAAPVGAVLDTLTRLLIPVLLLLASYVLWIGSRGPGGAFQAGALLSAAGVLLILAGRRLPSRIVNLPLKLILVTGPGLFLITALVTVLTSPYVLTYPPEWAGKLILFLETTAALSIGAILAALFLGERPAEKGKQ